MERYVTIAYEYYGRGGAAPIQVRASSVIEDKPRIIPRIEKTYKVFARDLKPEKREKLLEKVIERIILLNGRDKETQRILNGRAGVYSRSNERVYIDINQLEIPSLVEHETIHLLGETWIWTLPFPRRLVNHHAVAANITTTLLDENDVLGLHNLGEANHSDFRKLRLYKMLPLEFQEGIADFTKTCNRIGNYARKSREGYELLYCLSK